MNSSRILFADTGNGHKSYMNVSVFGFGGGESWNEKRATEAMRGAIGELVAKLDKADFATKTAVATPAGPVLLADVAGSDLILNASSGTGLKSGQTLNVKRKGGENIDPATGALLRVTYKTVGTIKLTNVEASYAEATVISGSDFKVGDMTEP